MGINPGGSADEESGGIGSVCERYSARARSFMPRTLEMSTRQTLRQLRPTLASKVGFQIDHTGYSRILDGSKVLTMASATSENAPSCSALPSRRHGRKTVAGRSPTSNSSIRSTITRRCSASSWPRVPSRAPRKSNLSVGIPRAEVATKASFRRIEHTSSCDSTGWAGWEAPPSVRKAMCGEIPMRPSRASVPPRPNVSSSGWGAKTIAVPSRSTANRLLRSLRPLRATRAAARRSISREDGLSDQPRVNAPTILDREL